MSYDTKCEELARTFLTDTDTGQWAQEGHIKELAQQIQDTIEDYILVEKDMLVARQKGGV